MNQKLNFVTLAVVDFNKELAFYTNVLDWKPFSLIEDTIAFFNVGGLVFSLCVLEELSEDAGFSFETKPYLGVTFSQNLPTEAAVKDAFAKIKAAGGNIVKEPQRASWGGFSGYFADPEGHLWELAYNPQFTFDDQSNMIVPE